MVYLYVILFFVTSNLIYGGEILHPEKDGSCFILNKRLNNSLSFQKVFNHHLTRIPQNIAIIDTEFYEDHQQLRGAFSTGYNAIANNSDTKGFSKNKPNFGEDEVPLPWLHGTHMASLAAQVLEELRAIHPVKIVPVKVGVEPLSDLNLHIRSLNYIAHRKDIAVVSISLNYPIIFHAEPDNFPDFKKALMRVINAGKLIVMAALNDGKTYTMASPFAQFVLSPEAKGRVIVVGASKRLTCGEEIIAGFSNRAGVLFPHFITAPGDRLKCASYRQDDDPIKRENAYDEASGTSHATAVVAASLAYLINQFPQLSIDDFPKIIFQSAMKENKIFGVKRSRETEGQGILHLDNARLLAATWSVHKRNRHFYAPKPPQPSNFKSLVQQKQKDHLPACELKDPYLLQKPRFLVKNFQPKLQRSQIPMKPSDDYIASSWGQWLDVKGGEYQYWVGTNPTDKEKHKRDGQDKGVIVHIPESIRADGIFKKNVLTKQSNVFYKPTTSLQEVSQFKLVEGEGKDHIKTDGQAFAYTVALNKEGKMISVRKGRY